MFNYRTLLLLLPFLFSCSFHRVRMHKLNGTNAAELVPDNRPISATFNIPEETLKTKTGIYSLENGGESLIARLWLFDHAQKTIDIQYYSFAKDVTGLIACHHLLRAADRGVKVRVLIDDAAARMNTEDVQLLESHDNIEIKIYNAGLRLGRMDKQLKELRKNYKRILRRMHNKTLTVDGMTSILGGRNIADRYFDYSKKYNFRDRDVIVMGNAVNGIKQSFDAFWNHELSVPYSEMSRRLRRKKFRNPKRFDDVHRYASGTKDFSMNMRKRVLNYHDELKAAVEAGKFLFSREVVFVSDKPAKNEDTKDWKGGATTDTITELIKQAKSFVDIQSPYFIITDETKQLINETVGRGIKIRLLTNSMGSTDNFEAFSGYKRDREEILKLGIQIREFKKDAAIRFKLMTDEIQKKNNYKAVYGFHPKTIVIDNKIAIVGSYNFDPRSAHLNTECFVVIRSENVIQLLSALFEEEYLPENSWEVTPGCNPDHKASWRKRFKVWTRRIVPKRLL